MRALILAIVVALLTLCVAQPRTGISGRQFIFCPCSPTTRGFRTDILEDIQTGIQELDEYKVELRNEGVNSRTKTAKLVVRSSEIWQSCVDNYSLEECVNADTKLRAQRGCAPNCASFCEYDPGTWRNNANGVYGPKCTAQGRWASKEPVITSGAFPATEVTKTAVNPNPGPERPPGASVATRPKPPTPVSAPGTGNTGTVSTTPPISTAAPISDSTPPSKPAQPAKPESTNTGVVNAGNNGSPSPTPMGPDGGDSSIPPTVDLFAPEPPPTKGSPGEGCVAAEHLRGYILQHSSHLRRPVLCAGDFCATPNHALIVDGEWTSLKKLCASGDVRWKCVYTSRWVNNLKVTANRRAVINEHITVTPYDLRFPRLAIWVVQIGESVLRSLLPLLLAFAIFVGLVGTGKRFSA